MIGNPSVADVTDVTLKAITNQAYRDIATKFAFKGARKRTSFTTIAGISEYNLPSDCDSIRRVWDSSNNRRLVKRGDAWLADQAVSENGQPLSYVPFNNYIQLVPPPDDVYTIQLNYNASIGDLVADTDVPVIPATWHYAIQLYASWVYYDSIKPDYTKATYRMGVFDKWVSGRATDIEAEKQDIDSGVEVPTLAGGSSPRLDFDHSE